jgi:hypothetical protein
VQRGLAFTSSAFSDAQFDEGKHNRRAMVLKRRYELSLWPHGNTREISCRGGLLGFHVSSGNYRRS